MARRACLALVMACAAAACSRVAAAQDGLPPLDAMILVQPQGRSALVAVVYPRAMPHAQVRGRFERLVRIAGWRLAGLQVRDEEGKAPDGAGRSRSLGKQTDATALLAEAPQVQDGAFLLQPYVAAFSDMRRFEVLFLAPADPAFQGLREFISPALEVRLVRAGGPYRYQVWMKDHSLSLPALPLIQPRAIQQARTAPEPAARPLGGLLVLLGVAATAGLAVFALLMLRARHRVRRSS
jgi:hypothetical protein